MRKINRECYLEENNILLTHVLNVKPAFQYVSRCLYKYRPSQEGLPLYSEIVIAFRLIQYRKLIRDGPQSILDLQEEEFRRIRTDRAICSSLTVVTLDQ